MAVNDSLVPSPKQVVTADRVGSELERWRQLEHFAELGRLSASLLHEISNPLTAALLYLEQYDTQQLRNIHHVRRNMLLLQRYVEAVRQQIRRESQVTSFYVRPQVDQVRRVLAPLARRKQVRLQVQPVINHKVVGDPVKFQQILANLVINAIDAYDHLPDASQDKVVIVMLSCRQQWLCIQVADHGTGIPANQLQQVFEPFYSTKSQYGQGLGIGLAVVKQHVEDFGGSVRVTSSLKHGTEFTAKLRLVPRYA